MAQNAENNTRESKLKASKAPPVYKGLHDISLAKRDVYMFLAISHYTSKRDFIAALEKLCDAPARNDNAFDEQKYVEARSNYLQSLIAEHP